MDVPLLLPWGMRRKTGADVSSPRLPLQGGPVCHLPMAMVGALWLILLHGLLQPVDGIPVEPSTSTFLNSSFSSSSALMDHILSEQDPRVRPFAYAQGEEGSKTPGPPVNVKCGIYVVSFGSISELNMDYTMDIYMRMYWIDPRLAYDTNMPSVIIPAKSMDQVWIPDLFFPNEKSAAFHHVTVPNKLMRIYPNGSIVYSVRITMTMACHMILTNFPMDYQECYVTLESYGHETKDMTLDWSDETIEAGEDMELPQFDLEGVETVSCVQHYKTGDFPCLKARFRLRRQFGYYLLQTYIPSILIVILSWVSFWINMDAVPARISLGVTTVLTMATQLTGSRASIPKVSYPKAIDVWMSMCMVFVFASLLEYAFVNVMARKKPRSGSVYKKTDSNDAEDPGAMRMSPLAKPKETLSDTDSPNGSTAVRLEQLTCEDESDERPTTSFCPARFVGLLPRVTNTRRCATLVDVTSRYLFPGAFILFNIVYWIVYTRPRKL